MFVDFIGVCFDQVLNQMAKFDTVRQGDFPVLQRLLWCGIGGSLLPSETLLRAFGDARARGQDGRVHQVGELVLQPLLDGHGEAHLSPVPDLGADVAGEQLAQQVEVDARQRLQRRDEPSELRQRLLLANVLALRNLAAAGTGNGFASFLLGMGSGGGVTHNNFVAGQMIYRAYYAGDQFQVGHEFLPFL